MAVPATVHHLVLTVPAAQGAVALGALWQGLQSDLDWPAPALAVDGQRSLQLWIPLAQAVPLGEAQAMLAALQQRYLPELRPHQLGQWPAPAPAWPGAEPGHASAPTPAAAADVAHTGPQPLALPPQALGEERWSAFVAPELVPLFADTPWLELPPNPEAQASLLSRVQPVPVADWARACAVLAASARAQPTGDRGLDRRDALVARAAATAPTLAGPTLAKGSANEAPGSGASADDFGWRLRADREAARMFLRAVMDDRSHPLAARIDAARALLDVPTRAGSEE